MSVSRPGAILFAACTVAAIATPAGAVVVPATSATGLSSNVDLTMDAFGPVPKSYGTIWYSLFFTRAPTATVYLDLFAEPPVYDDQPDSGGYVGTVGIDPSAFTAMSLGGVGATLYGARMGYTESSAITDGLFSVSVYQPTATSDDLRALVFSGTDAQGGRSYEYRTDYEETVGPVPEPATWMMMAGGFGALGYAIRRARRRSGMTITAVATPP